MRRRRVVEDPDRVVEGPVDERPENWWRPWAAVLALLALAAIGVVLWLVLRDSGGDKAERRRHAGGRRGRTRPPGEPGAERRGRGVRPPGGNGHLAGSGCRDAG